MVNTLHWIAIKYCIPQDSLREYAMKQSNYCNKCGKEFDVWDKENGLRVNMHLGYGSVYDGSFLHMNFCCDCMDSLIKSCTNHPVNSAEEE